MCAFICDSCIHKKVCQSSVDGPCNEACALYTKDENFNSTQQLKAEIAALATELQDFNDRRVAAFGRVTEIVAKLRQLSAV